ncbi:MAG: UDP-N-acetylenolpyruvoylglucosamine reductase, partial [Peptoniphilus sp.]
NKATAQDVLETIEIVQKVVHDKFDVTLEREVKIIGD